MGCFIVQILANADSSAIRGVLARGMFARMHVCACEAVSDCLVSAATNLQW
jgi:hypothetical protein